MSDKKWRDVVGYEGYYEVSSTGAVRRVARHVLHGPSGGTSFLPTRLLSPTLQRTGYLQVALHRDGIRTDRKVHHLVAEAFIGPRPPGAWVLHGDDNKLNNAVENLRYGTPSENVADAISNGKHRASRTHCKNGHELMEANVSLRPGVFTSHRRCRACHRVNQANYLSRRNAS